MSFMPFIACVLCLLLASCTTNYKEDLTCIYQTIKQHHPGIHNQLDPQFESRLDEAYEKAANDIAYSVGAVEQRNALVKFVQHFDDTHVYISWFDQHKIVQKRDTIFKIFAEGQNLLLTLPSFYLNEQEERNFKNFVEDIPDLKHFSTSFLT